MKRGAVLLVGLLSLATFTAGCAGGSPTPAGVKWEIERRFPGVRLEQEEHVRLGRISLGLVRGLVRLVPGKPEGQELLSSVRRVEMAAYKVHSLPDLDRIEETIQLEERLLGAGWSTLVRSREKDSRAWVFSRMDNKGAMRNLFVVELNGRELTMVRVDGRLNEAIAAAMAREPRKAVRRVSQDSAEKL